MQPVVAYFSMEIGLDPRMPTYSGGLGVLAGDTLRAAADSTVPVAGITLVYRKGYFHQAIDPSGNQAEEAQSWPPESLLEPMEPAASIRICGRVVHIRAWRYVITGQGRRQAIVYFLDTDVEENCPEDRRITDSLYMGDMRYRLMQEAVLGLGGIAMLRALGHTDIQVYHMNEGHSALLGLALLEEGVRHDGTGLPDFTRVEIEQVRRKCVFTTHTPVAAGHDKFPMKLAAEVLGDDRASALHRMGCCIDGVLNMTYVALFFSRYINGVSMRHEQISQGMFPNYPIDSITNGVHAVTWTSEPFRQLYDRHVPDWRRDNHYLRYVSAVSLDEVRAAHSRAKDDLVAVVEKRTGVTLEPSLLTIGFARRATAYKRADLLFYDPVRLHGITDRVGPLQLVFAGKAHPKDLDGKEMIRRVMRLGAGLSDGIRFVYLPEYDIELARYVCSGVDLWLNTPEKPHEASGTSGMKAALNGVPSLSVLDGWWVEGCIEGVTGWSVGHEWRPNEPSDLAEESSTLYEKLEFVIAPLFYNRPRQYAEVMRNAIALNGSFYNAQRMFDQYAQNAYQG